MDQKERDEFIKEWDREAQNTVRLLGTLPVGQYDFRPDQGGRSLGELAWHLAEVDAYISYGLENGRFDLAGQKPPGIERPKRIEELKSGYERVHRDAVARVKKLGPDELERELAFFDGKTHKTGDLLWVAILHHLIHHRGQLVLMCRLAGGCPTGLFGPTREETAEMMKARS